MCAHRKAVKTVGESSSFVSVVRVNIPSKHDLPDLWNEVRPHFPMPSPRLYQKEALSVIYHAIKNDDFDNIILQAPTGIGKSAVAMTVQNLFKSAYLLTPTLGLTDQYLRDYPHLPEVKGRGNFDCWVRSGTAADAPCHRSSGSCPHTKRSDPCPYYEQKFNAADERMVLSNPAFMFRVTQSRDGLFTRRDFAIIDEAHNLESFMLDLFEVKVTERDYALAYGTSKRVEIPIHYYPHDWVEPITDLHDHAVKSLLRYERESNDDAAEKCRALLNRTLTMLDLLKRPEQVVVSLGSDRFGKFMLAKPVRVNEFAVERLESVAEKRIFLSATILDVDTFLTNLGLDKQRNLYVNITKSPFPAENFKVHFANCGPLSYSRREKSIPRHINAIAAIMEKWPDKRGVVLPHTHAIRESVVRGLIARGLGHRIVTHGSDARGRNRSLKRFFAGEKGLVLISTYVGEGFDFKGELAEWLCICKVPFLPFRGDPQIEQRMEEDEHAWRAEHEGTPACPYEPPNRYSGNLCSSFTCEKPCQKWYRLQTALKLVQGAGRIVRTPDDVGHLFILDGSWERFSRHNLTFMPQWFRNALCPPPAWLKRHLN